MTAGKLASAKPAATTNTLLYRCPINKSSSSVLHAVNQGSSSGTYRASLRDYDQTLTLDSANYFLQKGNVVSTYALTISPGVQVDSLAPGDIVTSSNNEVTFKYFGIFKPTTTITIPVKLTNLGQVTLDAINGSFSIGDTITGSDSGLTASLYRISTAPDSFIVHIDILDDSSTTFNVSDPSNLQADDYIYFNDETDELVEVTSITGYIPSVTRSVLGTSASEHNPGIPLNVIRPTVTTTTLSVDITDTAETSITLSDSTGFTVGNYLLINNEIMSIDNVSGNNITVSRGVLGTTASTHASSDTVTLLTDEGNISLNYFEAGEEIGNGTDTALVSSYNSSIDNYDSFDAFVYDLNDDGVFYYPTSLSYNIDRTYKFTLDDISNTGHLFRFSITEDGSQYSTGVTISGTAGTAGSYVEIDITSETSTTLYTTCTTHAGEGLVGSVNASPLYDTIYIYDIDGSIVETETSFNTVSGLNTILVDEPGPYGYVQSVSSADVKISLGYNSTSFVGSEEFYDSPRTPGALRSVCTVDSTTSVTDVEDEDYISYDQSITSHTTDKNTGIVIGSGQSIVVYSSSTDINFILNGFEDITNDYEVIHYDPISSAPGGGGGPI